MKTAVSLPEELFEDAEKMAKSMGIPRSQLFAKALEEFVSKHKKEGITDKYDEVYSRVPYGDSPHLETIGVLQLREVTKNDAW